MNISALQTARYAYKPKTPPLLAKPVASIKAEPGPATRAETDHQELAAIFPHTYGRPIVTFKAGKNPSVSQKINVGVILSGGQAPGGHNVIAGLFDGIKKGHPESKLYGFLGGPSGIIGDRAVEITAKTMDAYRNTGGFDIIGSGRTKIETPEQFEKTLATAKKRRLRAVVVIGGDDSNTNAALLAEFFASRGSDIQVIGVPKTIDGDLKNDYIETSFGFDTAVKTYSELIGNIARDANSAKKYWHFIKLMGRAASHICLECALQTRPNIALISEEVEKKGQTLGEVIDQICDGVAARAARGLNYGIVLVPEGLVEFIPEMKKLISGLSDLMAHKAGEFSGLSSPEAQFDFVARHLSADSAEFFGTLPRDFRLQLLMDRDPHGNVQVSRIETEKLLVRMTEEKLEKMKARGAFTGVFDTQTHFLGYEGRSAFPTNFDADYCYSLGFTAFLLIAGGVTGYISSVRNLARPAKEWIAGGIPLTMMMNMEQRHGSRKPVIKKALVDLEGKPFREFAAKRKTWAVETSFLYPGAIQYFGPDEVCNQPTKTIVLEAGGRRVGAGAAGRKKTAAGGGKTGGVKSAAGGGKTGGVKSAAGRSPSPRGASAGKKPAAKG